MKLCSIVSATVKRPRTAINHLKRTNVGGFATLCKKATAIVARVQRRNRNWKTLLSKFRCMISEKRRAHCRLSLAVAVYHNNVKQVRDLLGRGADPNWYVVDYEAPQPKPLLCHTAGRRRPLMLEVLLTAGAYPSQQDASGFAALHYAITMNNHSGIQRLLQAGANPDSKTLSGWTPINLARNPDSVALLIGHGARANEPDPHGRYPIHIAASCGWPEPIQSLVGHGARVDAPDRVGRTALHRAVRAGEYQAVLSQLEVGASVHSRDFEGNFPLHFAAMLSSPTATMALISSGAHINARNVRSQTPLDLSIKRRSGKDACHRFTY